MTLYNNDSLMLLTDLYELTMIQGYYFNNKNPDVVFDMFFRREPFNSGYTVFAGLEPLVKLLLTSRFTDSDIDYLNTLNLFKPEFLKSLVNFKFTGDIYSVEEGTLVFPDEPIVRIHAPIIQAQLVESVLLNIINFQTLIATKTARIVESAQGRAIMEFGLRRAQGIDGALSATRAAYIGGASSTSNVLAGKLFNIPIKGTMAHSWIMSFDSELAAFDKYAELYPNNTTLLVDTYDTLNKGMPAAIKCLHKLKKRGINNFGIRLDSGDLEYLSKQARKMLDRANLKETKIVTSNELDEQVIEELVNRRSPIDFFGVGTKLVTANGDPALTGVYKLVSKKVLGAKYEPIIKISDNPEKMTNPSVKNVVRLYDNNSYMLGDLIFLESEKKFIERKSAAKQGLFFYHPRYDYKCVKITGYKKSEILLKQIVKSGKLIYKFPLLNEIQSKTKTNLMRLHPSHKRLLNPHIYKISITEKLRKLKFDLIKKHS